MVKHGKHRSLVISIGLSVTLWSADVANAACRQALAFALDVSGSVDAKEYRLQLDGLANALIHPDVTDVLLAMPSAPVRIMVFEWSGPSDIRELIPWRDIANADVLSAVTTELRATQRKAAEPTTALGQAKQVGANALKQQGDCWKRTLDISGDGKSNTGPHPREVTAGSGITVNALTIGSDARYDDRREVNIGELSSYFRAFVIEGPDAFVETALGFADYEAAMVRKLKRELEGLALSDSVSQSSGLGHLPM